MPAILRRHSVGLTWTEPGGMARAAHAVLDGERVWAWCTAGAALGAIQRLRRHPPDATTRLLLDLAAAAG